MSHLSEMEVDEIEQAGEHIRDSCEIHASRHAFSQKNILNTSDMTPSDQNMGMEDELRSEATFQLKIENFSKMNETVLSPAHHVRGLPW